MRSAAAAVSLLAAVAAHAGDEGAAVYARVCAHCHETGIGPVITGRALPADYVLHVVRTGPGAMPAFRPSEIDDRRLAALAAFVHGAHEAPGP